MTEQLGGDRLGSGNKQDVHLKGYERSTHDLGYTWKSTMASGTIVPFLTEVALTGDSMDIDLRCDVLTHPTIGPLFGSFKVQLDVFVVPVRLYQGKLHMNLLDVGMDMSQVQLPQIRLEAASVYAEEGGGIKYPIEEGWEQIDPSCIFSYLGIRGLGMSVAMDEQQPIRRYFNAVPWLGYWDIYKNYYANKQEGIGMVIHNPLATTTYAEISEVRFESDEGEWILGENTEPTNVATVNLIPSLKLRMEFVDLTEFDADDVIVSNFFGNGLNKWVKATRMFSNVEVNTTTGIVLFWGLRDLWPIVPGDAIVVGSFQIKTEAIVRDTKPKLQEFDLKRIDDMRMKILKAVDATTPVFLQNDGATPPPYSYALHSRQQPNPDIIWREYSCRSGQEGLAIKTYQSDLFNNWLDSETIVGDNGINAVTSIDTSKGYITIDEINISNKLYNMLNRIAISGGTYNDWNRVTYGIERVAGTENPVYVGGLSKELVFQEIVSNSASAEQPLGTLAGRGVIAKNKHKGGSVKIRVQEMSYVIGLISLTPRLDYSQGNKWDVNLKTMNDFHKPELDQIGFQNLVTDQMAWFDTGVNGETMQVGFKSAGKQPAWLNYTTNVDVTRGNFAIETEQMWMTLNRRYEIEKTYTSRPYVIKDLTTYIDPSKFNNIFADTRLDAQNFWVQVEVDNTARRKMSARMIPNL